MKLHEIPRDYKGEGRILYIFTTKSFIYSVIGAGLGWLIHIILKEILKGLVKDTTILLICMGIFALIGYGIASIRIPENSSVRVLKKVGGEKLDQVIIKYIKFKRKKNKIYVYTKEEK